MSMQASGYLFADKRKGVSGGARDLTARKRSIGAPRCDETGHRRVWRQVRATCVAAGLVFVGFLLGSAAVLAFAALSITAF